METLTLSSAFGGGGDAYVAGADTQIQYNSSGALAGSADLTWNDSAKELGVGGDINLDDGGTYETTVQVVTPTANRTISFPDATGTVALVAGSSGQLTYNSAGAQAGLTSASIGSTGEINISLAGAASTPPVSFTGSWFTGGTATTTKPQLLIEPTGTTSTAWSTSGTGLGVNAASGFGGSLLELQVNGTRQLAVSSVGTIIAPTTTNRTAIHTYSNTNGLGIDGSTNVIYSPNTQPTLRLKVTSVTGTQGLEFDARSGGLIKFSTDLAIARDSAGVIKITDGSTGTGYVKQVPVLVSQLPAAATVGAGTRGFVSDATSTTFAAAPVGGGANTVPVYSDGTNWLIG
jgi:hypothetical protein